jgi:hypothetical protein
VITASGVPRALRCVGSLALPRVRIDSPHAAAGTAHHEQLESDIDTGNAPDDIEALISPGDIVITEQAFAYNVATDTARRLTVASKRAYQTESFEIPGTPDLVIVGQRLTVVDHKSNEEVDSADRNEQTATYALTLARFYGRDEVDVVIRYKWRRPSQATLTALDLDAHAARLKQLQIDAATARANPIGWINDGPWCKYCDAALACPKWADLTRRAANGELALHVEAQLPFANDSDAAAAWDLLGRLKLLTGRLEGALKMRAKERPFLTLDGLEVREVIEEGNRRIDGEKAYELIRSRFGTEVADDSVKRTVSQKGIEEALKKHGLKPALKAQVVKDLEAAGAVTRETKTTVKPLPPIDCAR